MLSQRVGLAARTRIDVKRVIFKYILVVAPAAEIGQIVAAHNDREAPVGVFLAQSRQRDDGVGRYGQVHLDVAGAHTVVVVDGHTHHLQPMVVGKQRAALLQRILRRDDKPHLGHIGQLQHRVGNNQMPHVNRVERTEKQTDMFHKRKTESGKRKNRELRCEKRFPLSVFRFPLNSICTLK